MRKFLEYFDFEAKSKIKASEGQKIGLFPFYNSSNRQSLFIDNAVYSGNSLIFGTGGNASLHYCATKFSTSTDCLVASTKHNLDVKYYYYYLLHNFYILEKGFKGAGLKHTSKKYIDNILVPDNIHIHIQQEIVAKLDLVSSLIDKRKEQIALLDKLVQAQFLEIFGDPVANEKGWEIYQLSDLCSKITDGTHQSPTFTDSGVPFLFVSNLSSNAIDYNTEKFISIDEYNTLIKRTPIEIGDILLTTVGSYGHPALVKDSRKFCFQRHIAYLKPIKNIVNSYFLHASFMSSFVKNQIDSKVKGIAQKTLNLSELKSINIPLPPLPLQNEFAEFVTKVEAQRERLTKGLTELQTLFDALMQEAFE